MSQINLSNWEIVDDVQNSRIVIRSKTTGEQLELNESGVFGSSSGIDADTVDGVEAAELGSDVSDDGTTVTSSSTDLNFTDNISASNDGDGTSTIAVDDAFVLNDGDTMSGDLDMGATSTVTNLDDPSNSTDAATKAFVESVAQGLTLKDSVRVSNHDTNIDLTSTTDPNPIDGLTLNDGDRILLKHQTDLTENGIYDAVTATDPTTWVRSPDFDEDAEVVQGAFTFVRGGTHANESYVVITPDPITLGTDDIEFAQFSSAGQLIAGDNLERDGDTFNVIDGSGSGLDADTLDGNELADIGGGYNSAVVKTTSDTATDRKVLLADATSGDIDITLPLPTDGQLVTVKKIDSSNNAVNIVTQNTETIDGQSSISITNQFAARETISNGTNYFII